MYYWLAIQQWVDPVDLPEDFNFLPLINMCTLYYADVLYVHQMPYPADFPRVTSTRDENFQDETDDGDETHDDETDDDESDGEEED